MSTKKLGLVLEGGASRAYFTVGVLDALEDLNIRADVVVGVSAGIANGISYVSGQRGRNIKIGLDFLPDKRYMGLKHWLNPKNRSLYNIKFVFDDIPNKLLPFDYAAFKNSNIKTYCALTNIKTGHCEYVLLDGSDKKWTAVVASCALPLLFKPIELGGALYMDGGIANPVPIDKAFSENCDKIITVLTRESGYVKKGETGLGAAERAYRKYPEFIKALKTRTENYNKLHDGIFNLEKENKTFVFAPRDTNGWQRTERRPEMIKIMYDSGFQSVMRQKERLSEYLTD